jgi:integrase
MPKIANELGPLAVSRLGVGMHAVGGVAGLYLTVRESGAKSWLLRIRTVKGRRELGLGAYSKSGTGLADARIKAKALIDLFKAGIDPVNERKEARSKLAAKRIGLLTFDQAAAEYIETNSNEWKNAKHAQQWRNTLATYASPTIGNLKVNDIEQVHIIALLRPIWNEKTETASRVRGRVETVLDWAKTMRYRTGDNPAKWTGNLDNIFPKRTKVAPVQSHKAMHHDAIHEFVHQLRSAGTVSAITLEFLILTACRSGEVRGAKWSEVDLEAKTWTIPAIRMKAGKAHVVPLSGRAMALIESLPRLKDNEYLFTGSRTNRPLSDMALTKLMRDRGLTEVPHGFRATFKTWAGNFTSHKREAIEKSLAHEVGNAVEQAYERGSFFEMRTELMQDWANFIDHHRSSAKVLSFKGK